MFPWLDSLEPCVECNISHGMLGHPKSFFSFGVFFFFSSRRRHTRCLSDWSSDVCSSDLDNLYERVRALFFLYAIHRFHIPLQPQAGMRAPIPFAGYVNLLKRRFEEAIDIFLAAQTANGPSAAISSALAAGYRALGFQTLADQVRRSVRSVRGNQWMFRTGHPADYPLRVRPELLACDAAQPLFTILREATPVRMDLTHSGWSDIFFLGMDFPEGARVLNISIDLSVYGAGPDAPRPPVEAYFRVIDRPVLRLSSEI